MTIPQPAEALLQCPFCKHDAEYVYEEVPFSRWRHRITCAATSECGMEGPLGASKAEAIKLWNTRAALSKPVEVAPEDAAVLDEYDLLCMTGTLEMKMAAKAAVLARMAGNVPTGWKLVPVEPTLEMKRAGCDFLPCTPGGCTWPTAANVYDAMLAAAPEAPR